MDVSRYVAIGDSQTEGMNDLGPDGRLIGWADRFAAMLATDNPGLGYANLALRGSRTDRIRRDQLDAAISLGPDLVTVMAGVNDVLGAFDLHSVLGDIEAIYLGLQGVGARVVGCTFPDPGVSFPLARRLTPRVLALNAGIRDLGSRHDVVVVDFERYPSVNDVRLWSDDRLHLNSLGHARMATAFADVLGVCPDPSWQVPLPPFLADHRWRRPARDVAWAAKYWAPWLVRHLRGRSTGDGRSPKRPTLAPIDFRLDA